MQAENSVPNPANIVAGLGATNIVIQPNSQSQSNTQYVTLDMNNRAQIINLPQQTSQYIAVQPGGFQVIPIQGGNAATQFVQLQLPNVQQAGSNFIQIQPTNTPGKIVNNSNINQTFIPVQQIANQTRLGNNNQKVSIQLVQHPGISPPKSTSGLAQSLVGTKSIGESSATVQVGTLRQHPHNQGVLIKSDRQGYVEVVTQNTTSPSKTISTTTSSSLFQALQQAASIQSGPSSVMNTATLAKNVVTKTFSTIRLPQPNLNQIMRPNVKSITNPSPRKNENKPIQAANTFVVVSGHNQQPIVITKTQSQPNPVFVPITMANNVSVLTNQTPALMASKRAGQPSQQAIPIRIQHQIAPRLNLAKGGEGQSALMPFNIANLAQQLKFAPVYSSDGTVQQQNQQQQIIFQPVQQNQNLVRFASQLAPSLQAKKEALANIVPGPKPVRLAQPLVTSANVMAESKPVKKPCNCTKSQCLKLYCECFANGEFCSNCNCRSCFNSISHEAERSKAIKSCLERNPYAFHPKIGKGKVKGDNERRHTKGCNCKRSGCLKNYCECYEAKILCSSLCRCNGCKNFEESDDRKTLMQLADAAEARVIQQNAAKSKLNSQFQIVPKKRSHSVKERLPLTFLTADVSKATCDILLATALEAEKNGLAEVDAERSLIIEFSRCLDQIIDKSNEAIKDQS